jgi:hypothetical protein
MSRSASSSYKGYTYQRARLLHLIFCEYYSSNNEQLNSISFCEENLEDIDISITDINGNTEIHLYQEKYLSGDENESFIENSGLTKVIISHYNKKEITKINYEVVSLSGNISCSKKLNNFLELINDDINNPLIGKFIVLNFCNSNLFSTQESYEKFITDIKNNILCISNITEMINERIKITERDKNENSNRYRLNKFCHYCNDDTNITDLIIYLQKINFNIIKNKTFNEIHSETHSKLKNILPEFNQMCSRMSNEYNNFYSETLYGLFEMIIVKNLFQTNDKMTIKQLIDIIKDKITNSITNDDRLTIVIYTIKHFIRENKYDEIKNKLFDNNCLINFMLNNKITITKFICNFDNEKIINNTNIGDIIRTIIYNICILKNYKFLDDVKLLGFLYRTHKNIKFTGLKYNSLKGIDNLLNT